MMLSAGVTLAAVSLFTSCVADDFSNHFTSDEHDDDVIRVRASLNANENTRASYDTDYAGDVTYGTFYMTYPRNTVPSETMSYTKYDRATVTFGHPEDPETGYASFEVDGRVKDLKWSNIKGEGGSSVSLYLHNIDPSTYSLYTGTSDYNTSSKQKYNFNSQSPYVASPLDTEYGTNDLIVSGYSITSGGGTSAGGTEEKRKNIKFNLFHRMALLRFQVKLYGATDNYLADLSNAKVYITNLCKTLKSINLSNCSDYYFVETLPSSSSYSYGQYGDRGDVYLVGGEDERAVWQDPVEHGTVTEEGEEYEVATYRAPDFVFPPQTINSLYPPQIIVVVPKKDITGVATDTGEVTYSGFLPNVMYEIDENGDINYNPLSLRLNTSYILNVTATINSPNAELSFSPVTVENWVSKGSYSLTTKKAGIYNASDFRKLIDTYQNGRFYELERYGFQTSDNSFVFQLWANIFLDGKEIRNAMSRDELPEGSPSIEFSFLFNGYSATITEGSSEDEDDDNEDEEGDTQEERLSGVEGQQMLYEIVTGAKDTSYWGINDAADMLDLISHCHQREGYDTPDKSVLLKYGNLNSYDNCWTFCLESDMELNLDDIYQQIDPGFINGNFKFDRQGHSITLNKGGKKLVCEVYDDYDEFTRLTQLTTTYGIYEPGDFYLLGKCYRDFYTIKPEMLSLFADYSDTNDRWTLYFRAHMTLQGDKTFYSLVPDPENGRPNYSIYSSSSSTYNFNITIDDPLTPCAASATSNNSSYLIAAFAGSGCARGTTNLATIISYYNSNNYKYLWYYGRYEDGKWIFPLTYKSGNSQQTVTYSGLFGQMVPDENDGKYDYEFYLGEVSMQVTSVSSTPSTRYFYQLQSTASYPNSAADLKKMALGTYWVEEETQP